MITIYHAMDAISLDLNKTCRKPGFLQPTLPYSMAKLSQASEILDPQEEKE